MPFGESNIPQENGRMFGSQEGVIGMKSLQLLKLIFLVQMIICMSLAILFVHSNSAKAGTVMLRPSFRNMDDDLILNSSAVRIFEWTPVATADYYILQWSQDKVQKDPNGNYTEDAEDVRGISDTNYGIEIDDRFKDGWWFFHVRAVKDQDGNGIFEEMSDWSDDLRMGMDFQQPELSVSSPGTGDVLNMRHVTFSGQANDTMGLREIQYAVDGDGNFMTGQSLSGGPRSVEWNIFNVVFEPGMHSIEIRAMDIAWKFSEIRQFHFEVDIRTPDVNITAPQDGHIFTEGGEVLFEGYAEDDYEITEIQYWINDDGNTIQDGSWSFNILLAEGANHISVLAVDKVGKETYRNITVFLNTNRPDLLLNSFKTTDGEINLRDMSTELYVIDTSIGSGTLHGEALDLCGIDSIQYSVNGGEFMDTDIVTAAAIGKPNEKLEWEADIQGLGEGIFKIRVKATDIGGVDNVVSVVFVQDDEQPGINIVSEGWDGSGFLPIGREGLKLSAEAVDNTGINRVEYKIDDGDWTELYSFEGQGSGKVPPKDLRKAFNITVEDDGIYHVTGRVEDLAGNAIEATAKAVMDNEDPTIQINDPQVDKVIDGNEVRLEVSLADNIGLKWVEVYVEKAGHGSDGSRATDDSASGDGSSGNGGRDDPEGNDAEGDDSGGSGQGSSETNGQRQPDDRMDLAGDSYTWETFIGDLESGENTLRVVVSDVAGRIVEAQVNFWIDTDIPEITITGPDSGITLKDIDLLHVEGSAGDDSGRLKKVEVRVLNSEDVGHIDEDSGWSDANLEEGGGWSFDWNVDGTGPRTVQVRAYDELDRISDLHSVEVTFKTSGGGPGDDDDDGGSDGTDDKESSDLTPPGVAIVVLVIFVIVIVVLLIVLMRASRAAKDAEKRLKELEEEIRARQG